MMPRSAIYAVTALTVVTAVMCPTAFLLAAWADAWGRWAITGAVLFVSNCALIPWSFVLTQEVLPKMPKRRPRDLADAEWIEFQEWKNGIGGKR